jgi:hypothetical protein
MPKEFYTERDIEDMARRGILSLEINDDVVLTDLAYEKANRLGVRLVRDKPDNPPAAPVRPYLSQQAAQPASPPPPRPSTAQPGSPAAAQAGSGPATPTGAAQGVPAPLADGAELRQRIRSAVIARLGAQVDSNLLDVIITRVLNSTGVR